MFSGLLLDTHVGVDLEQIEDQNGGYSIPLIIEHQMPNTSLRWIVLRLHQIPFCSAESDLFIFIDQHHDPEDQMANHSDDTEDIDEDIHSFVIIVFESH